MPQTLGHLRMLRVIFLRYAAPLVVRLRVDYSNTMVPQVLCIPQGQPPCLSLICRTVLLTKVTTTRLSAIPSEVNRLLFSLFSTSLVAVASRLSALDNRPCSRNRTATRLVALPGSGSEENTLSWMPPTARVCFCDMGISQITSIVNKRSRVIIKVDL